MDEVLLIQECLKGKRKAQGELYRRYAAKMMLFPQPGYGTRSVTGRFYKGIYESERI